MLPKTQDIVVLSLCAFLGNIGVALTGFGMAIIFFFVYQIAYVSGFEIDFKYALFVQALSLASIQPLLLYKSGVREHASRKMLFYFIPITLVSTPLGQWAGDNISTDIVEVVGGAIICLLSLFEIINKRAMYINWLTCGCKRNRDKTDPPPATEITTVDESLVPGKNCPSKFDPNYALGNIIAEGDFMKIREAERKGGGASFIVKVIKKSMFNKEEENRYRKEVEILRELNQCKNIVHLYDFYDEYRFIYLVKKMMHGGDLNERLAIVSTFNEKQTRQILRPIFDAISFIHSKNIVHRDLKLESILFESQNMNNLNVKLTCFGFAKKETKPGSFTTICGNPAYMAPEIVNGAPYGKKVDMWSLGVIAFNLLSGKQPFPGEDENAIKKAILDCDLSYEGGIWDEVTFDAKSFVESLLTVIPSLRPDSKFATFHSWFAIDQYSFHSSYSTQTNDLDIEQGSQLTIGTKGKDDPNDMENVEFGCMTRFWTLFAGGASGFLGGFCGIRGPPIILYFLYPPSGVLFNKNSQRATGACITAANVGMRIIFYAVNWRQFRKDDVSWFLFLYVGCSYLGVLIGAKLFDLLKDSTSVIRGILTIFLVLCGVSLMWSALQDLI